MTTATPPDLTALPAGLIDDPEIDRRAVQPEGARFESGFVIPASGPRLFVRRWRRLEGERGLLVIIPGYSDHGARYPHLIPAALERGLGVLAFDTRGHGRSEGRRGHVASFDDFVLDLNRVLTAARREDADLPVYLWGHSMGGLIVLSFLSFGFAAGQPQVRGACASAPALRVTVPVPKWKDALAYGLESRVPWVPFQSDIVPASLSRDLSVGQAYLDDPLVHQVCTPRLYAEMQRTAKRLRDAPVDFGLPLVVIHGEADPAIDIQGSRDYVARSSLRRKALFTYPEARHEIHNDPAHPEAFRDALGFLLADG